MKIKLFLLLVAGMTNSAPLAAAEMSPYRIIDTHAHLLAGKQANDILGAAADAVSMMQRFNIYQTLVMPPPQTVNQGHDETLESYAGIKQAHSGRFAFLGGGGSLNVMIQEALQAGTLSNELRQRFSMRAKTILQKGAIGFGEMTAEHVSRRAGHPYVSAPPDHPLFLLLADLAAEHDVPIDLHMEAISADLTRPDRLSSTNPGTLSANIDGFKRLLTHNPASKIIWSHAGWDNTGARTVDLMRDLLEVHSNLYMSLKVAGGTVKDTRPTKKRGRLKGEWKRLIEAFPKRFMIGSDMKYRPGGRTKGGGRLKVYNAILKRLNDDVAENVAYGNAEWIFKIAP